jgi:flagellin
VAIASIQSNALSIQSRRHLRRAQGSNQDTVRRLSSGIRLNSARDDASGLSMSQIHQAQIRGAAVAIRNADEAVNILQTADGAISEWVSSLQRMREIAVQAASDSSNDTDRKNMEIEYLALNKQTVKLTKGTEYNGEKLLSGIYTKKIRVGADAGLTDLIKLNVKIGPLGYGSTSVKSRLGAEKALLILDFTIDTLNTTRSELGSSMHRFEAASQFLDTTRRNLIAANGFIEDADVAEESGQHARNQVMMQAATSIVAQANAQPHAVMRLLG